MTTQKTLLRAVSIFIILLLVVPIPALSQDAGSRLQTGALSKERLAQMLAPIALYPDALLTQVLMASTYPLELVEADRWIRQNPNLKGDSLDEAMKDREWDPSVKSLCHFPSVLGALSENIALTTKLGDAFLAQQDEVMDMVQELREKAMEQGTLLTTQEQKVVNDGGEIIIETANPGVIYVPAYNPVYAYGPWWYPGYPPYFWGPGAVIVSEGISFWPGIFVGVTIGSWSYFDWHSHRIHLDWDKTHGFHHSDGRAKGPDTWQHNAEHRRGVAYRDRSTAQRFGQSPARSREAMRDVRGFPERGGTDRQTIQQNLRKVSPAREGSIERGRSGRDRDRDDAFSRSHQGKEERQSGERGRTSRENLRSGESSRGSTSSRGDTSTRGNSGTGTDRRR